MLLSLPRRMVPPNVVLQLSFEAVGTWDDLRVVGRSGWRRYIVGVRDMMHLRVAGIKSVHEHAAERLLHWDWRPGLLPDVHLRRSCSSTGDVAAWMAVRRHGVRGWLLGEVRWEADWLLVGDLGLCRLCLEGLPPLWQLLGVTRERLLRLRLLWRERYGSLL